MIKILNNKSLTSLTAENSVKKVLQSKPGGLLAMESQMNEFSEIPESLKDFKIRHERFFVVGIGGSSLGIQVLTDTFQIKNFDFIDNVDATHFEKLLSTVSDLEKVGWLFISKSGATVETLAGLDFIIQFLQEKSVSLQKHCLAITEKKDSDLYNWVVAEKILYFELPKSIGGRFSVLSAVGLVPAILMGLDTKKIQAGALSAYQDQQSLITLTEASLESFKRQEWITVLWSYSSRLKSFGLWWQQLWAESLAKKIDHDQKTAARVSTPLPLIGATDQHSTLQQIMEGARDKMVFFLRAQDAEKGSVVLKKSHFKETEILRGQSLGTLLKAEAEAIQLALTEVGVSNLSIQVSNLDEKTLGQLIMFFQLLVMSLGEALNINTFNQPGVELGKIMAKNILKQNANVNITAEGAL